MAFIVKIVFFTAVVCSASAGYLSGQDSYSASALSAPSASYGPPSSSYGAPGLDAADLGSSFGNGLGASGGEIADDYHAPAPAPVYGAPHSGGSLNLDASLHADHSIGGPKVIGTHVTYGQPNLAATRYELQSVLQKIVRRIPVEVVKHVKIGVPHAVPYPVRNEVKVPVPQPYPVHVNVEKKVPYPVYKNENVEVEKPVPYEVVKEVPFEVIRKVPVPIPRPYEVIREVPVPVVKHIEVPVPVWQPHPIHIIKHVTHYKKKSCCW